MDKFTCQFCNKETKNPGAQAKHIKHCKLNPNYVKCERSSKAGAKKGCIPWNKGSIGLKTGWNKGIKGSTSGKGSTPEREMERIRKISEKAKINNGGVRQGSGRGKKGKYKGYWCDSSWELAFVVYNIDHNITFSRNTLGFEYEYEGKKRKFFPDFVIGECFYEIKGYFNEQTLAKIKTLGDNLIIIDKKEIQKYLKYVKDKYGKDFLKLYGE